MSLVVEPQAKPEVEAPAAPAAVYSSDNPEADAKALAAIEAAEAAREQVAPTEEAPAEEAPAEGTPAEGEVEEAVGAVDYAKYSEEISTGGALSAESYAELEAKGFPKEVVDTYVRGLEASQNAGVTEILSTVGGEAEYAKISAWAQANMSEADLADYNAAVANPASARYAVKALAAQYAAAEGTAPRLVQSTRSAPSADLAPFESSAQMVAAMRDSRYKSDSAYRNQVQQRLARSNF